MNLYALEITTRTTLTSGSAYTGVGEIAAILHKLSDGLFFFFFEHHLSVLFISNLLSVK